MKNKKEVKVGLLKYNLSLDTNTCSCVDVSDKRYGRGRYCKIVIPETIKVDDLIYTVTKIEESGFYDCPLETLILPNTIERIERYSFQYCPYLKSIYIPKSVKFIGIGCFSNCDNLTSIEFEGNPEDIEIGIFSFSGTQYLKNQISIITSEKNTELEHCYIGRNLVGIDINVESLYIKPGTKHVCIDNVPSRPDIKSIYFPDGLLSFSCVFGGRDNYIPEAHFESLEGFLNLSIIESDVLFNNLYINGELITSIIPPHNYQNIDLKKIGYFKCINSLNLIGIKNIYGQVSCRSVDNYLKILDLYLPESLNYISCSVFDSVIINNFGVKHSILRKFGGCLYNALIKQFTLYLDDVNEFFNTIRYLLSAIKDCKIIKLVPIRNFSSNELYEIIHDLANLTRDFNNRCCKIFLDEDFLKINQPIPEKLINEAIFIFEADYRKFKNHAFWGLCKSFVAIKNSLEIFENESNSTCKLSYCLNEIGQNSFTGVVKIPKEIVKNDTIYRVTGLNDFTFADCPFLEEVVLDEDILINDTVFFNSSNVIITKI